MENSNDKIEESGAEGKLWLGRCRHHFGPLKFVLAGIGFLIILGGVFCLGRVSAFHRQLQRDQFFSIERGIGPTMMGNYGGTRQFGGRYMMERAAQTRLTGKVDSINSNKLTIKDNDGKSYTINVPESASIYSFDGQIAKLSDLKVGQEISLFGLPNSGGEINANFIRIK